MPAEPSLRRTLDEQEADLRRAIEKARGSIKNSGERGGQLERTFRQFLRLYLPSTLSVGHGEAFDLYGARSLQTDVFVLNEYQPFRSPDGEGSATSFIIEGIAAAGEVKGVLTKQKLEETIDKGVAFRSVHNSYDIGDTFPNSHMEDVERLATSPPYFLFAYTSEIADSTAIELIDSMPNVTLTRNDDGTPNATTPALDAIFILDRNLSLLNAWKNTGKIRRHGDDLTTTWSRQGGQVMTSFLFWLYAIMLRPQRQVPPALKYFMKMLDD